jgi:hypothetical protein
MYIKPQGYNKLMKRAFVRMRYSLIIIILFRLTSFAKAISLFSELLVSYSSLSDILHCIYRKEETHYLKPIKLTRASEWLNGCRSYCSWPLVSSFCIPLLILTLTKKRMRKTNLMGWHEHIFIYVWFQLGWLYSKNDIFEVE